MGSRRPRQTTSSRGLSVASSTPLLAMELSPCPSCTALALALRFTHTHGSTWRDLCFLQDLTQPLDSARAGQQRATDGESPFARSRVSSVFPCPPCVTRESRSSERATRPRTANPAGTAPSTPLPSPRLLLGNPARPVPCSCSRLSFFLPSSPALFRRHFVRTHMPPQQKACASLERWSAACPPR